MRCRGWLRVPKRVIGFIVNPIAGMGGSVGLKGTDGSALEEAIKRGAKPVSPLRALEFLNSIKSRDFYIVVAPGAMGADIVLKSQLSDRVHNVVGSINYPTTREDTIRVARMMLGIIDLLVFVGGDGTARDICKAIGTSIPVIGVPSGVKMYSAVFAINPRAAAMLLEKFLEGKTKLAEREVLDVDEDSIRKDVVSLRLYGYLLVPVLEDLVQSSKAISTGFDEEENKLAIARYLVENMERGIPYILGPGTTVKAICRVLNIPCTTLGVDVVLDGRILIKDAWEKDLLDILDKFGRAKVVITPIGKQGFIFGRGNQQISPRVLSRIPREDIIVVATQAKLKELRYLLVDTGDSELDTRLSGYIRVLVDYNTYVVRKVVANPLLGI